MQSVNHPVNYLVFLVIHFSEELKHAGDVTGTGAVETIDQLHVRRSEFINVLIARDVTAGVPFLRVFVWASRGLAF